MPVASIPVVFAEALALHWQGRLREAEARYTRILVKERTMPPRATTLGWRICSAAISGAASCRNIKA